MNPSIGGDVAESLAIVALVFALYFLPAIIGYAGSKRNATAILTLNLLLGWTLIGWVVAMVWAVTVDPPAQRQTGGTPGPGPGRPELCAACGKYSAPGTRFCGSCGAALMARS